MRVAAILPVAVRVLFGLVFAFFGANKVVPFLPMQPLPPEAAPFIGGLASTGYLLPLLGVIEVAAGLALLTGRFVPLALTLLAPIVVNIALFHFLLVPALPMTVFVLAAEVYLAWVYREAFRGVLDASAAPAAVAPVRESRASLVS